jgi:hypothetical protein
MNVKSLISTEVIGFRTLDKSNVLSNFPEPFIMLRFLKNCFLAFISSGVLVAEEDAVGLVGAIARQPLIPRKSVVVARSVGILLLGAAGLPS